MSASDSVFRSCRVFSAAALLLSAFAAHAQQPADKAAEKPAAAPTPPPSWQQGRSAEQEKIGCCDRQQDHPEIFQFI